ncbi:MAG: hypothetical protein ACJAS4_000484 [Bacteriovoracaceae bacterium]|jgi:hypothetical protein
MIEKISKKITQFYQISLVTIMICTLGTILYFWKLGFIDGSRSKDLHKASYILETYESKGLFKEIENLIINENPKKAIQKTKQIEKEFEKVNAQVEVPEFEELKQDLQKLKTSSANLISFSKVDKVITVFNGKMNKFYDYVRTNKWKTLTRMSDRVFSQTNGHINKDKLENLILNVNRDFESMIKITENSVLGRKDKSEIVSRVTNLQIEMQMLKKYVEERKFYYHLHNEASASMEKWLDVVAPELTLQKMKIEQIGRYYVMGLLGILFLVTSLFFISFLFNKLFFKKAQNEIEAEIENYINDSILNGRALNEEMFSTSFQSFTTKMSEYFNKRMSFGSIFQDALPLSSILLDPNLKVLWANKTFCDDWQISEDEVKKDYMSWDFLNKLTNIGNDDPVLEALKHGIAGIYQVQVKPNEESASRPYEMFVSPVKYQGETRIMLFFYDLTNLEQTIQDQAKSLISPIHKSLILMKEGKFEPNKELSNEFSIAGIDDVYTQFTNLDQNLKNDNNNLLDQIEILHTEVEHFEEQREQVTQGMVESVRNSKVSANALKSFKDNVINLSTLARELDRTTLRGQELIYANLNALNNSIKKVESVRTVTDEIMHSMPKFHVLKDHIRESKALVYENKSKLSHELSQLNMFVKRASDPGSMEKIGRVLNKVNLTFEEVSKHSDELDKKVSNLEVLMSKAQMVLNSGHEKISEVNTNYEVQQVQLSEGEVKILKKVSSCSTQNIESYEQEIVENLQSIFKATKNNIVITSEMKNSLDIQQAQH